MSKNVKYYIGNIEVRNGEYEYSSTVRFKTKGSPYHHLRKIASTWYGEKSKLQDSKVGAYYFQAGWVCVWEGECQELTREVYDAITLVTELKVNPLSPLFLYKLCRERGTPITTGDLYFAISCRSDRRYCENYLRYA